MTQNIFNLEFCTFCCYYNIIYIHVICVINDFIDIEIINDHVFSCINLMQEIYSHEEILSHLENVVWVR